MPGGKRRSECLDAAGRAAVVKTYRQVQSLRKAAEAHGITHERVRQICKEMGEPIAAWGSGGIPFTKGNRVWRPGRDRA